MSTVSTDGASFSIALASSTVRFGRRIILAKSSPEASPSSLNLFSMIVVGPSSLMLARNDWSRPRMSDVTPTIEVIPMTTPRIVRPDCSLLARSVSSAIRTISATRPLFTAQRLDRIQARRPGGGIGPEEQADRRGDPDTQYDRPDLEGRGQRTEISDQLRGTEAEDDPDDPATARE